MKFRAVIKIRGVNPYVLVNARRAARLQKNWRKPLPVRVRVNGKPDDPWRINMMPCGHGDFFLYLHETVRQASHTKVGDSVTVEVNFDEEYRSGPAHPLPSWFSEALRQNQPATQAWSRLIPSRQKEILRYFANLKTPESQQRNLQRAMRALSGASERFMGKIME